MVGGRVGASPWEGAVSFGEGDLPCFWEGICSMVAGGFNNGMASGGDSNGNLPAVNVCFLVFRVAGEVAKFNKQCLRLECPLKLYEIGQFTKNKLRVTKPPLGCSEALSSHTFSVSVPSYKLVVPR